MLNQSLAEKSYQAGVRCWATGGSVRDLPDFLKASGRTLKQFGRDVASAKMEIKAGAPAMNKIRAVPPPPSHRSISVPVNLSLDTGNGRTLKIKGK